MHLFDQWLGRSRRSSSAAPAAVPERTAQLALEILEDRCMLTATGALTAGTLTITGQAVPFERISLSLDQATNQLVLSNFGTVTQTFSNPAVTSIVITLQANDVQLQIGSSVTQTTSISGSNGRDLIVGGAGTTTITTGTGTSQVVAGTGATTFHAEKGSNSLITSSASTATIFSGGFNQIYGFQDNTTINNFNPVRDANFQAPLAPPDLSSTLGLTPSPPETLASTDVQQLLNRASAASSTNDAIIAIVDRSGRILGVRVESGVTFTSTEEKVFAIDGAVAEARTAALFANDQAPLTSRTVENLSQSTITQQEVDSAPNATGAAEGPGLVAPIGIKDQFPAGVDNSGQVDLFQIETSNRDTSYHFTTANLTAPTDPHKQIGRFNIGNVFDPTNPTQYASDIPINEELAPMNSYGFASGLEPTAQSRGIGTLPGGIPIYKTDAGGQPILVGGIGVFFPGATGYASEENSSLSADHKANLPDLSLEAEYMAFAAVGGAPLLAPQFAVGALGGVAPVPGIVLPITPNAQRIDLVGINLDIVGPGGTQGPANLLNYANINLKPGTVNGTNAPLLNPGPDNILNPTIGLPANYTPIAGLPPTNTLALGNVLPGTLVPEGFIVTPHNSAFAGGLTADQVTQMIEQGVQQALQTRAAIRLPLDQNVEMVFAVSDLNGALLGLFRMPDATTFSLDIAVGKARNVEYLSNPNQVQPQDLGGFPAGTAVSSRTVRYLALPRFPEGVTGNPGPYSILNDGGVNPYSGLELNGPIPVSSYQSAQGYAAFNPEANFHNPNNILNQNGVVFFPGAVPLYTGSSAVRGGIGISGDGVDQDDVITFYSAAGFTPPPSVQTADQIFVRGVRLPYQKFNRTPQNG